jgi:hypothetical protein
MALKLMSRQEIQDTYGFDPGSDTNQTIVPKGNEQEQIGETPSLPDPAKLLNRNQETPTASPGRMIASGAIRTWTSDPLMLAGIASAGLSAALKYTYGDPEHEGKHEFNFTEQLYKPGGIDAVANNLREHQAGLQKEHPDWTPDQIQQEMMKYQASSDFFKFHTDHMSTVYGTGMKLAAGVNGLLGVPKTPQQETWADEAAHILGSVILPSPGVFAKGAGSFLSKLGVKSGGELADLALPGTAAGSYTPSLVAKQAVGGIGIGDVARTVTGQPSAIRGDALTPRNPDVGGPSDRPEDAALGPRPADYLFPGIATGAVVLGAAGALRGKPRLDPAAVHAGPTIPEQVAAQRQQQGLEPLQADPVLQRQPLSPQAMSQALNEFDPVEQLARDVAKKSGANQAALEVNVQAAHGLDMDRQARLGAFKMAREEGIYGNNVVRGERTIKQLEDMGAQATPEVKQKFADMVAAMNSADQRLRGIRETTGQYLKDPNDPTALNNLAQRLADTPESRPSLSGWTDRDIGNRINAGISDPDVMKLYNHFTSVNQDINRYLYRSGMLTDQEYITRQGNPAHIPMFEMRGMRYDPDRPRTNVINPVEPGGNVTPNNVLDPFSGINVNLAMAINEAKHNDGLGRVINTLRPHDPTGEFVRRLGPADQFDLGSDRVVHYEAGVPVVYQFSRESVAQALKAQPLMLSPVASFANAGRGLFQYLTTGPIFGGPASAVKSALYDATTGYVTAREGRSFGLLSQTLRQANDALGGSEVGSRAIDSIRALDVSAPFSMAWSILPQTYWRSVHATGRAMMDAAVTDSGLLGKIAQLPGGRDVLDDLGSRMAHAAEVSTWGVMKQTGAIPEHPRMNITPMQVRNEYERIAAEYQQVGKDAPTLLKQLKPIMEPYYALIDNMHHMGQYAFFANNYAVLKTRYGGAAAIPPEELTRLAEETRRFSGDIWAHGGSQAYNEAMATVPYGNINLQAFRHLALAATTQGSKQSLDVATRLGVLAGGAYAGIKFIEDMGPEAKDWYWNQLPDWQRTGSIPIPSGQWIKDKLEGKPIAFDPNDPQKYVYLPKLAAELTPITQMHLAALEGLGLIDRGKDTAGGSGFKDVAQVTGSAIGLGSAPMINALLASSGYKMDLLGPMGGRPVVQQMPQGELGGRTPGGIPQSLANVVRVLGGLGGDMAIRSADAALQSVERDHSFTSALEAAGLEAKQALFDERYPTVPGLWKAEGKVYQSATSSALREIDKIEQALKPTYSREFGKGRITNELAATIQDPDVRGMVAIAHKYFSSGAYLKLKDQRARIESQMKSIDAQKSQLPPDQQAQKKRSLSIDLQAVEQNMLNLKELYEDNMKSQYGEWFDRQHVEPKLDSLPILVERYQRKTPQIAPGGR